MIEVPPEIIAQYPAFVLMMIFVVLLGLGIKWGWTQYKEIRKEDLAWRADQNRQREEALKARDEAMKEYNERQAKEWKEFFLLISAGNQADIADMRTTATHLVDTLDALKNMYSNHDTRAQQIQKTIDIILADVSKIAKARGRP